MAFAVTVLKTTNVVVGMWRGAGAVPVPDVNEPVYCQAITQVEHEKLQKQRLVYGGEDPKWEILGGPGGALTKIDDPRVRILLCDISDNPITKRLKLDVGDVAATILVKVVDSSDVLIPDASSNVRLRVSDGRWLKIQISNGRGSITIRTDVPKDFSIDDQGKFNLLNPLRVRVHSVNEL